MCLFTQVSVCMRIYCNVYYGVRRRQTKLLLSVLLLFLISILLLASKLLMRSVLFRALF